MPNTLVHFGVQGITSRGLFRNVDIKWILLGCVVPDIPWILRRAIFLSIEGVNRYDLHLYASVQASFAFALILCGFFAVLSKKPRLIFSVLAFNSLFHLLLDAVEIKWGNGVHLFAPFSWDLLTFALVWPESLVIRLLTAFGFIYSLWMLGRSALQPVDLSFSPPLRIFLASVLLIGYFASPLAFLQGPAVKDNHSVETLRAFEDRPGKHVDLDRRPYTKRRTGDTVRTFAGEDLRVVGEQSSTSGHVSIRGVFIDSKTINAHDLHEAKGWLRDGPSYIGIAIFMIVWARDWFGRDRNPTAK
jgi:hypothetical protein